MKKIGIIGGVGPQATSYLYSKIISFSQELYMADDNDDFPHLIIESVPIPDFISDKSKVDTALNILKGTIKGFQSSNVDRICIASNTVHILLNDLAKETNIPFISMIDLVSKKCSDYGYKKVGLLATPVLTGSGLYDDALRMLGIELVKPEPNELLIVESIIRGVLAGHIPEDKKASYIELMNKLYSTGAEGIILGCTELPLAFDYKVLGKRAINSDEVLAEGIVNYYYS
jgi:aspartate racemase